MSELNEIAPEPSQFYDQQRQKGLSGEAALVFAILNQSIMDLATARHKKEALAWIIGSPGVFSFDYCCECLGIEAGPMREHILGYHRQVRRKERQPIQRRQQIACK